MTDAAVASSHDRVARLWLATLQEIAQRAAHEVKNALNGVAVNLEVVRGRLSRPGATADGAARFAATAGEEFERVTAYAEALLALSRAPRTPVDVAAELRALRTLLAGGESPEGELARTSAPSGAPGDAARLALAAALLAAADGAAPCAVESGDAGVVVRVARGSARESVDAEVADAARDAGIGVDLAPNAIILTFPPVRDDSSATRTA